VADWFYAPSLSVAEPAFGLPENEARHLAVVLRARPGHPIVVFDGSGRRAAAEVSTVGKRDVVVRLAGEILLDPPPPPFTLGVALPKGDRAVWLVEKCVELGVGAIVPLQAVRSVAGAGDSKLEKLRRAALEACKQCQRSWLPVITDPEPLAAFLARRSAEEEGFFLDLPPSEEVNSKAPRFAAVGPEGGWTDEERGLAEQGGWRRVSLAPYVLRVETAAIAVAAVVANPSSWS
jgi:16S rRNA (uracil1498-N3)-methyltransferase